jgi:hypothetical protein
MKEETGKPIIRAVINNNNKQWKSNLETRNYGRQHNANSDKRTGDKNTTRLDHSKTCNICLLTGHHSTNCIPFAKYLLHREAENNVDAVTRSKLIEHYKHDLRRKKELRIKRQQLGTIRQMWNEGGSFEDFESSLFDTLPDLKGAADYSSEDAGAWDEE